MQGQGEAQDVTAECQRREGSSLEAAPEYEEELPLTASVGQVVLLGRARLQFSRR